MKLTIKNLTNLLKNHRVLALIICIVEILSIFSLFTIYAKVYSYTKSDEYYTDELKTFTVTLSDEDKQTDYSGIFDEFIGNANVTTTQITSVLDRPYLTYAYYKYPSKQKVFLYYGSYFNEQTFCSDNKFVVAGLYSRMDENSSLEDLAYKIGEQYEISGEDYEIIGVGNNNWNEISYFSLDEKQNLDIESIEFSMDSIPKKNDIKQITSLLTSLFPNSEISEPLAASSYKSESSTLEQVISVGICILAVLTLLYIFRYIFNMRKKTNEICIIVGIKKSKVILSMFLELFLSSSFIYLICSLLFGTIFSKIMLKLDIIAFEMGIVQYIYLYAIYIVIIMIVIGIGIISSVNKSASDIYRRAE